MSAGVAVSDWPRGTSRFVLGTDALAVCDSKAEEARALAIAYRLGQDDANGGVARPVVPYVRLESGGLECGTFLAVAALPELGWDVELGVVEENGEACRQSDLELFEDAQDVARVALALTLLKSRALVFRRDGVEAVVRYVKALLEDTKDGMARADHNVSLPLKTTASTYFINCARHCVI